MSVIKDFAIYKNCQVILTFKAYLLLTCLEDCLIHHSTCQIIFGFACLYSPTQATSPVWFTLKRNSKRGLHAAEFETLVLDSISEDILHFTTFESTLPASNLKINGGLILKKHSLSPRREPTSCEVGSSQLQRSSGRTGSPIKDAAVRIWGSWRTLNQFQILLSETC